MVLLCNMQNLTKLKCVPCEGGVKPFTKKKAQEYLKMTREWELLASPRPLDMNVASQGVPLEPMRIQRKFVFKDFAEALKFVNKVGHLVESENHHPDIYIHNYKKVDITLSTHAIGGLSTNDFIMAAKINQVI